MVDVSKRIAIIFTHPKADKNDLKSHQMVGVTFEWLVLNGVPQTERGKAWDYYSVELIQ